MYKKIIYFLLVLYSVFFVGYCLSIENNVSINEFQHLSKQQILTASPDVEKTIYIYDDI